MLDYINFDQEQGYVEAIQECDKALDLGFTVQLDDIQNQNMPTSAAIYIIKKIAYDKLNDPLQADHFMKQAISCDKNIFRYDEIQNLLKTTKM